MESLFVVWICGVDGGVVEGGELDGGKWLDGGGLDGGRGLDGGKWLDGGGLDGGMDGGTGWMEVPGWRAAGWRKVDWRGLDGGKWLDGGMDGVKMRLGLRGSMSCVVSRGSRFLRFTGVDGSWRFGSGLRFGSRPSCL